MNNFQLSEVQARAILDMRLQRLTGLERDKIKQEHAEIVKQIEYYREILSSEPLRMKIIKDELLEVKEKYGDERRTEIVPNAEEFNPEDFYADDDVVITISHLGYIKRTQLSEFRTQNRGGVGYKGSTARDEDFLEYMFSATMHNTMLFFTEKGKCFWLKVYEIPEGSRTSKGRAIQNIINIAPEDNIRAFINVKNLGDAEFNQSHYIVLGTRKGVIKKTLLEAYSRPRTNGINAINIREGDELIEAKLTNGQNDILLAVKSGKAIRFPEKKVRAIGRTGSGVRGISLAGKNDAVIGMVCVENPAETSILVVSEKGFGKRTYLSDPEDGSEIYRITNRGAKGVKTMNITEKTGSLIAMKGVTDNEDLMIITKSGLTIRLAVSSLRLTGRATQGVKLINLRNGDSIAAVSEVAKSEEVEEPEADENAE